MGTYVTISTVSTKNILLSDCLSTKAEQLFSNINRCLSEIDNNSDVNYLYQNIALNFNLKKHIKEVFEINEFKAILDGELDSLFPSKEQAKEICQLILSKNNELNFNFAGLENPNYIKMLYDWTYLQNNIFADILFCVAKNKEFMSSYSDNELLIKKSNNDYPIFFKDMEIFSKNNPSFEFELLLKNEDVGQYFLKFINGYVHVGLFDVKYKVLDSVKSAML